MPFMGEGALGFGRTSRTAALSGSLTKGNSSKASGLLGTGLTSLGPAGGFVFVASGAADGGGSSSRYKYSSGCRSLSAMFAKLVLYSPAV